MFPLAAGTKDRPLLKGYPGLATRDEVVIQDWWRRWPNANPAAWLTSPLVAFEREHGFEDREWEAFWEAAPGGRPETRQHRTASGAPHLLLRLPPELWQRLPPSEAVIPGFEASLRVLRWRVLVLPGAVTEQGRYEVTDDSPIATASTQFSEWLVSLDWPQIPDPGEPRPMRPAKYQAGSSGTPYGLAALTSECEVVRTSPNGSRNNQFNKSAFRMGQLVAGGELAHDFAFEELEEAARATDWLVEHSGSEGRLRATLASGLSSGTQFAREAKAFNDTDLGNAERLVERHGDELRWCPELSWLVWDGKRWGDGEVAARRRAVETVRSIYSEALAGTDADARKRLGAWAMRSEAAPRIAALLELARWKEPITVQAADLDADPSLLNVRNGTIDLRTGELREHRPSDLCSKLAPVDYDPDARSEVWEEFLQEATAGQEGLSDFLQRAVGYTLTGSTREDRLFVLHGPGGAGKTTFVGTVRQVLGDYAGSVRIEALTDRGGSSGHSEDVAVLAGKRLVLAVEASESDHLREGLVKHLTGGDQVPASRKFKPVFFFTPQFKLW